MSPPLAALLPYGWRASSWLRVLPTLNPATPPTATPINNINTIGIHVMLMVFSMASPRYRPPFALRVAEDMRQPETSPLKFQR